MRSKRRLGLKDFDPCTILLNNDLSAGIPGILEDLHEQYLLPPLHAGWSVRRKSNHFQSYEEVSKRFGKLLGIDPWLINPMFNKCGEVNFAEGTGMDCLTTNVDALLTKIRRKYKEYGINEKPFVVVKADNGTYGMGIMTVRDVKDLDELNRRTRNKMSVIKDGQAVSEVIIQEGVLTNERINDAVAEPVVYMMDRYVVGGFYRVHAERGIDENLNAPGASFVPLAFAESTRLPQPGRKARRQRAQPLLHVRRDRPPGHAGRQLRTGSHRSRRRGLRLDASWRRVVALLRCNMRRFPTGRGRTIAIPKLTTPPACGRQDGGSFVQSSKSSLAALTLGAIGVVYGDIGTSVLYAVKEVFGSGHVPFTTGQRLRHPVHLLLDADGDRLAQVRDAGAARRQQRRRRPDRHAGAGLAGGQGQAASCGAGCWWSASSAPACSMATASSRRRSRCCRRSRAWRWCRPPSSTT